MNKIHANKPGWRPPLGDPYEKMAAFVANQNNTNNLSNDWRTIDGARHLMAEGWKAVTGQAIPEDALIMLKAYEEDLEV